MQRNQISALVAAMFASAGVLVAGAAHADNFVDRGNPDNALNGQCIDGTNPLCVATKSGTFVATSSTNFTSGTNAKAGSSGIAIGDQSNAGSQGGSGSGGGIAIGVGAQALANSATAIGTVAVAQGNTALAVGRQSAAIGDYSMALGNVADAHGTSSIALGHSALASGDRSIAIGGANPTTSDGVSNGASYDAATQTRAGGTQSVAIGAGAQTNDNNQVAIGSGSVGANNGGTPVFGGTAAPVGGAVSFGSLGHERQIKNVAAGAADTDAVNVEQLKNVNSTLSTGIANVDARVTSVGNTLSTSIANVDQRVSNVGNSLSTSIVTATQNVVKYTDDSHAAIALDGSNGTTINGVAAGVADTDAVNVGQLKGSVAPLQTSLSTAAANITNLQNNVTGLNASLSTAASNIGGLQAADARNVKYDGASGFDSVTFAGPNGTTLHNVADGKDAHDAVNAGQLGSGLASLSTSVTSSVSTTIGNLSTSITSQIGNATKNAVQYDDDAHGGVTLGGQGAPAPVALHNVADGVSANDAVNVGQLGKATDTLNQSIANVGNSVTKLGDQVTTNTGNIAALQQDALQWNPSLGTYDASHGGNSPQRIGNLAAGQNGTDAVNVDQLNAAIHDGTSQLDALAVKYDDASKHQVSLGAGNGGIPVRVTNVAEGNVSAGSTDAVNGAQLRRAIDGTAAALGGGATANTDGSITAPAYKIGGDSFNNVGDALTNLDGRVGSNTTTLANHETRIGNAETNIAVNTTAIAGLQKDALQFDPTLGAYNAARGGAPTKLTSVADGNVAAGSTDAVNGGQLYGVKSDLEQQITQVSNQTGEAVKNVVKYDVDGNGNRLNSVSLIGGNPNAAVVLKNVAAGTDDTDAVNVKQLKSVQSNLDQLGALAVQYDDSSKGSITLGGAGGTRITNVKAGTLSATSTDAVNGSQLYATNQQVSKNTTDIANLQDNVTNIANGKAGLVQQQDPKGAITVGKDSGGTSVNFSGTAGDRVLTGVAAGVNANDAVNMAQFNDALKTAAVNDQIRAAATDANTTWIARADAGSIGSTATATGKNAVAVGQGSVADRDNSFSVGAKGNERQVTNVAAGTAPTDAVNVQQLNDNLNAASTQAKGYTDQRIGQVYNSFNDLKKDMYGGVASAMAVAGLPQPTGAGRSMVSAATSNYHGQQGFAAGYSYVTENNRWVVKASVTGNARSDFGAVVGAGYQF
ncbi:coiled stalk of trimeric autotransporter adhesin family protein [Burkholderia ambifaria AMMD]|uniref:YadA C-terminal domain protein n=1 Tax=Burkholderia ambifaria (strain ATCC BAA-244 / DSM 16087 / CCUG 44356 / LMG 19182 / AMMD) TaxID=339670 RepID=Q0B1R0_BURCM|nr:YadA-like family protein [Burkholderia ambifaria]ABI91913.1 YadA C-terminal domain protein [Burkholderia ambifaria AMMD]AJY26425.1 coiled stalk of trimeric autotransporter adhesin family protein [Burkholderia ambifaria AMMD]MBR7932555.1 YadA-like family protein [Burkholderia ambifaria]PEH70245.1 adhesin [Burkholderia ambifaria]QQC08591.1 YadA-like family protein [Burkholderia ambifaria]